MFVIKCIIQEENMRKSLFVLLLGVLGMSARLVYAKVPENNSNENLEEWREWHRERMDWKREQVEEAVDEGLITEDKAKTWNEHYDSMEEFHEENGFMHGPGGCHDGRFNRNNKYRYRMGH